MTIFETIVCGVIIGLGVCAVLRIIDVVQGERTK